MSQTETADRGRYEMAADALDEYGPGGYLMYLNIYFEEKEVLTDADEVLLDVVDEWKEQANPPGPDPDTGLLRRWLDYKLYEDYFPTVEEDLTYHLKCIGCGQSDYPKRPLGSRSCGCPVGFRDGIWYDCQNCDEEYLNSSRVGDVPLCEQCFSVRLQQAKDATEQSGA